MKDRTQIGLDHVGIVSGELDRVSSVYTRLGFRLTPRQRQAGPIRPGEQPVLWGTANRCAMLQRGYIELLGIVDPDLYDNQLGGFLKRGEGIHILALSVGDAESQLARLAASQFPDPKIHSLIRNAETPDGERRVEFLRIPLPSSRLHGGRVQLIEHRSADILWQKPLLEHPNRAIALVEVVLRLKDLDAGRDFYRRALASDSEELAGGTAARFRLAAGDLVLATDEGCRRLFPEDLLSPTGDLVAFGIRTDDGAREFRRITEAEAVPYRMRGVRVIIGTEQAGGTLLWAE